MKGQVANNAAVDAKLSDIDQSFLDLAAENIEQNEAARKLSDKDDVIVGMINVVDERMYKAEASAKVIDGRADVIEATLGNMKVDITTNANTIAKVSISAQVTRRALESTRRDLTAAAGVANRALKLASEPAFKKCPPISSPVESLAYSVSGKDIWPGTVATFLCPSVCEGGQDHRLRIKYFNGIGGGRVENLLSATSFRANTPSKTYDITSSSAKAQTTRSYGNNYGAEMRGYFKAPATGNHYFYLRSDDSSWVEVSTKPFPEHAMKIASKLNGCCREQGHNGAPIYMEKGKYYLTRTLMKEGGGGDYVYLGISWPGHTRVTRGMNGESAKYFECPPQEKVNVICKPDGTWSKHMCSTSGYTDSKTQFYFRS